MRVTVICDNDKCRQHGRHREVGLQHLGQGVYIKATLACECGHDVRVLEQR